MRRLWPLLLLAACQSPDSGGYVPRGEGVEGDARELYARARRLEYRGEEREALALLDRLCTSHPLRLGFHFRRLRLARELDGPEAAAALYRPPPPGVDAMRAEVLSALARTGRDDLSERRGLLSYAAEREPDEPYWRLALAGVLLSEHDAVLARARLERELGRVQVSAETMEEAIVVLDRARAEAEAARALDEGFAEAELLLGYIDTRHADLADEPETRDAWRRRAGERYERALELDPESLPGLLNRAENQLYFDRYAEAARTLEKAAESAPGEERVWNNLGYAYYATGRLDAARVCYAEALRVGPGRPRIRAAFADVLQRMGEMEEARVEFERARAEAGDDRGLVAEVTFKLAALHEFAERYKDAIREYERYVEMGGPDAAKAASRIRHIYRSAYE